MKHILLATVASLALSLPAMAAQNGMQPNNQTNSGMQPQQTQMNNQKQSGSSQYGTNQQAMNGQQRINPTQLSKKQITKVQQALNDKGFDAKHVDGIWGPETDTALENFQKKNSLPGNGHLNQQTLSALGVNIAPQAEQGTVGQGPSNGSMNANGMNSNQPNMNQNGSSSSSTNGMGSSNGASGQMGTSGRAQQPGSMSK